MNTVCVLGLGYVGLPTAALLATIGFKVIGLDTNPAIVKTLQNNNIHIKEPGLRVIYQAAFTSGKLRIAQEPEPADVFIIAVPTPLDSSNKADLQYVLKAAKLICPHLRKGDLVILESTSPPGTTKELLCPILAESGFVPGHDIQVAYCPERVFPGQILKELITNDRIIGGIDHESAEKAGSFYQQFVEGQIMLTDSTTAEMAKLAENTYRDVNIALANELALISEQLNINVWEVLKLANHHPRVHLHQPGPGVGGHCIPVDPLFIAEKAPIQSHFITTARFINDLMPLHVASRITELVESIELPRVTLLGLAYKADVDDIRSSPTLVIAEVLKKKGIGCQIFDPHVQRMEGCCLSLSEAVSGSDLIVLLTAHKEFIDIGPESIAGKVRRRVIYDTRQALDRTDWEAAGFTFHLLGESL